MTFGRDGAPNMHLASFAMILLCGEKCLVYTEAAISHPRLLGGMECQGAELV